jgi:hypothetical protein
MGCWRCARVVPNETTLSFCKTRTRRRVKDSEKKKGERRGGGRADEAPGGESVNDWGRRMLAPVRFRRVARRGRRDARPRDPGRAPPAFQRPRPRDAVCLPAYRTGVLGLARPDALEPVQRSTHSGRQARSDRVQAGKSSARCRRHRPNPNPTTPQSEKANGKRGGDQSLLLSGEFVGGSPNLRAPRRTPRQSSSARGGADNRGRKGACDPSGAGAGRVRGDSAMTDACARHLIIAHTTHGPITPAPSPPWVGRRREKKNTTVAFGGNEKSDIYSRSLKRKLVEAAGTFKPLPHGQGLRELDT